MAAKSCICGLLACLLALATAAPGPGVGSTFTLNWTLDWIEENYPEGPSTPLKVELNDVLQFNCNNGTFANIYILSDPVCRCDESETCIFLANCRGDNQVTSRVQTTSGTATSLVSYEPGTTYYFTSFAQSDNPRTVFNTAGGECVEGFQLVVEVQEDSTPPPVTPVATPPSRGEPSEPSQRPSLPGPGDTDRPGEIVNVLDPQGLGGAASTASSGSLTLIAVLLCTIITAVLRH